MWSSSNHSTALSFLHHITVTPNKRFFVAEAWGSLRWETVNASAPGNRGKRLSCRDFSLVHDGF